MGVQAIEEELSITVITVNRIAHKNRSGKKTVNEKKRRIKWQIFVKWGRGKWKIM